MMIRFRDVYRSRHFGKALGFVSAMMWPGLLSSFAMAGGPPPSPTPTPDPCQLPQCLKLAIAPYSCPKFRGDPWGGYGLEVVAVDCSTGDPGGALGGPYGFEWGGLGECGAQDPQYLHRAKAHTDSGGFLFPWVKVWKYGCDPSTGVTLYLDDLLPFGPPVFVDWGSMTYGSLTLAQTARLTTPPCTVDLQGVFNEGYFHHDVRNGTVTVNGNSHISAMNPQGGTFCNECVSFGDAPYPEQEIVPAEPGEHEVTFPKSSNVVHQAWQQFVNNQTMCRPQMLSYTGPERRGTIYQVGLDRWIRRRPPLDDGSNFADPVDPPLEVGVSLAPGSVVWAENSNAPFKASITIRDQCYPNLFRVYTDPDVLISGGEAKVLWDGLLYIGGDDTTPGRRLLSNNYLLEATVNFDNRSAGGQIYSYTTMYFAESPPDPKAIPSELEFTYRNFIPCAALPILPVGTFVSGGAVPLYVNLGGGDGRSFSCTGGTHRAQILQTIPLTQIPIPAPTLGFGASTYWTVFHPVYGLQASWAPPGYFEICKPVPPLGGLWTTLAGPITGTVTVTPTNLTATLVSSFEAQVQDHVLDFGIDAGPALVMGIAPAIQGAFTLRIRVDCTGTIMYKLEGQHTTYPAFEAYLDCKPIYRFNPEAAIVDPILYGTNPVHLFLGEIISVDKEGWGGWRILP